ncbi:MAG: hypothetical protein H6Q67_550, partial [Firmicutes bacterium]|nr:hypothetical protein [Bacillota bacterium]
MKSIDFLASNCQVPLDSDGGIDEGDGNGDTRNPAGRGYEAKRTSNPASIF